MNCCLEPVVQFHGPFTTLSILSFSLSVLEFRMSNACDRTDCTDGETGCPLSPLVPKMWDHIRIWEGSFLARSFAVSLRQTSLSTSRSYLDSWRGHRHNRGHRRCSLGEDHLDKWSNSCWSTLNTLVPCLKQWKRASKKSPSRANRVGKIEVQSFPVYTSEGWNELAMRRPVTAASFGRLRRSGGDLGETLV